MRLKSTDAWYTHKVRVAVLETHFIRNQTHSIVDQLLKEIVHLLGVFLLWPTTIFEIVTLVVALDVFDFSKDLFERTNCLFEGDVRLGL